MKKIFLMLIMSVSLFANWKVDRNTAYVVKDNNFFKYNSENQRLGMFLLEITANNHEKEVMNANINNIGFYIADVKNPNDGVGIESAKSGNMDDFFNLVSWKITDKGLEASILESSVFFEEIDKILKKSSSFFIEIWLFDEENDNSELFYKVSFTSMGYTKSRLSVDKYLEELYKKYK